MTKINIIFFHKLGAEYFHNRLIFQGKAEPPPPKKRERIFLGSMIIFEEKGLFLTELVTLFFTNEILNFFSPGNCFERSCIFKNNKNQFLGRNYFVGEGSISGQKLS